MVAIVDYGVGNLFSLERSFRSVGVDTVRAADAEAIRASDRILLPGVGAFGDAADALRKSGLADVLIEEAHKGKPFLGVCLGMQLLFDVSYEYGVHKGLGLIPGRVVPIRPLIPSNLKVPQIGWNALNIKRNCKIMKNTVSGENVYFVHSYHVETDSQYIAATAEYGTDITAAVEHENVMGCQFHPEKSGDVGLEILKAFCEVK